MKIRVAIVAGVCWVSLVPIRAIAQGAAEATAAGGSPRVARSRSGPIHTPRFGWRQLDSWCSFLLAGESAAAGGEGRAEPIAASSFERGDLLASLLPHYRAGEQRRMLAALSATGEKGRRDPAVAYLQALVTASAGEGYDRVAAGQHLHRFLVLTRPKDASAADRDDWAMLPFLRQFELVGTDSVATLHLQAEGLQRQIAATVDLPLVDFAEYSDLRTSLSILRTRVGRAERNVKAAEAAVARAKENLRKAEEERPSRGALFNDSERAAHISTAKRDLKETQDALRDAVEGLAKTTRKAELYNARLRRYEEFRGERRPLAK